MDRILGAPPRPLYGEVGLGPHLRERPLRWGLPPYQVASWCIQPFVYNRNGPKIGKEGSSPFWGKELGPHLTQSRLGWCLPPCQVPSWSIRPFGHNKHGPKIWKLRALFGERERGPHLTQNRLGRGRPPYQWHLDPCRHMVNFGPLTAEICWRVWGTPANFNGFQLTSMGFASWQRYCTAVK